MVKVPYLRNPIAKLAMLWPRTRGLRYPKRFTCSAAHVDSDLRPVTFSVGSRESSRLFRIGGAPLSIVFTPFLTPSVAVLLLVRLHFRLRSTALRSFAYFIAIILCPKFGPQTCGSLLFFCLCFH